MGGWGEFVAAFGVFFLSHSIPVRPANKARVVARIGGRGFTLGYSALSIAVLSWLIVAAGRAPLVVLWPWAPWQNHVPLAGMAAVCLIACLTLGRPNPLSFGGMNSADFDPARPGIVGWMRHPLLIALLLWALSHMAANGTLAHVILFAVFAAFSLLGMKIIDRRQKRVLGKENWTRLSHTTRTLNVTPNGLIRTALAAVLYLVLLWLHGPVIGAYPLG